MSGLFKSSPAPLTYAFIDGAYLTALLSELGLKFLDEPLQIDYASLAAGCKKTFYYDSLPARKGNESDEDYEDRRANQEDHFNYLRSLNGWHVSEGVGKWNRKRGSSQKEVDILIAVDMLTHTHRRNMEELRFIAGDRDFRPLIEAVVSDGMYVTLWYGEHNTSDDLIHAADSKRALDIFELYNYCLPAFKLRHVLPTRGIGNSMYGAKIVEVGYAGVDEVAWLEQRGNSDEYQLWAVNTKSASGPYWVYQKASLERLKQTYAVCHGAVEWRRSLT